MTWLDYCIGVSERKNAPDALVDTIKDMKKKRYDTWGNYASDVTATNFSRSPAPAFVDSVILGEVSGQQAFHAVMNSLGMALSGGSIAYSLGQGTMVRWLDEKYQESPKLYDAAFSSGWAFLWGMTVNLGAGYPLKEAVVSSTVRAGIAYPTGPITRYYLDTLREIRGEPVVAIQSGIREYSTPKKASLLASMLLIPPLIVGAAASHNWDGKENTSISGTITVMESEIPTYDQSSLEGKITLATSQ